MSKLPRVLYKIAVVVAGVGCIVGGLRMKVPPEREPSREAIGAWGDLSDGLGGWLLGWLLIIFGALLLLGLFVFLVVPFPKPVAANPPPGRGVDPPAPPLPEARAHFRPPDEMNRK